MNSKQAKKIRKNIRKMFNDKTLLRGDCKNFSSYGAIEHKDFYGNKTGKVTTIVSNPPLRMYKASKKGGIS